MDTEHFAIPNLSVVSVKYWFLVFGACDRTFMCSVFTAFMYSVYTATLILDDKIFYGLLTLVAAVQSEDVHASFMFVGDLNGHHLEWLSYTTTNRHGVAAFDFATVCGSDQFVVGPTHARGGTLDLQMTDIPDLI